MTPSLEDHAPGRGPAYSFLKAEEAKIEEQVPAEQRGAYLALVVDGLRGGLEDGADGLYGALRESETPIEDAAVFGYRMALLSPSRGAAVLLDGAIAAAHTLTLGALIFVDQTGVAQVGRAEVSLAMDRLTRLILKHFGYGVPDPAGEAASVVAETLHFIGCISKTRGAYELN